MRPIGRSRNVVRMLAAMLMPERCSSGHCGKFCRWSHLVSSARGQRNCWPTFKAVSWYPICQVSVVRMEAAVDAARSCRPRVRRTTAGIARWTSASLQDRCSVRWRLRLGMVCENSDLKGAGPVSDCFRDYPGSSHRKLASARAFSSEACPGPRGMPVRVKKTRQSRRLARRSCLTDAVPSGARGPERGVPVTYP